MSLRTSEFYYKNKSNEEAVLGRSVPEQLYSLRASLDMFLAKLFFPGDEDGANRVLWTPRDYVFYRRLEQLGYEGQSSSIDDLQLPFAAYHRKDSWTVDDRPAGGQLSSVMSKIRWGEDGRGFESQAYFAQQEFECGTVFASERDAHHALSLAFWWNNRTHWLDYKLTTGGTEVVLPASIELTAGPAIMPESNMSTWMKERKMSVVDFFFRVRTPLLKVEPDQPEIFLTDTVAHYFNSRHFNVDESQLPTTAEGWKEISEVLVTMMEDHDESPSFSSAAAAVARPIEIEYSVAEIPPGQDTATFQFTWDWDVDATESPGTAVPDEITFYVHRGRTIDTYTLDLAGYTVVDAPTSFQIEGNAADSVFDVRMAIKHAGTGAVRNYYYQIATPALPDRYKGLGGLKGMTL